MRRHPVLFIEVLFHERPKFVTVVVGCEALRVENRLFPDYARFHASMPRPEGPGLTATCHRGRLNSPWCRWPEHLRELLGQILRLPGERELAQFSLLRSNLIASHIATSGPRLVRVRVVEVRARNGIPGVGVRSWQHGNEQLDGRTDPGRHLVPLPRRCNGKRRKHLGSVQYQESLKEKKGEKTRTFL